MTELLSIDLAASVDADECVSESSLVLAKDRNGTFSGGIANYTYCSLFADGDVSCPAASSSRQLSSDNATLEASLHVDVTLPYRNGTGFVTDDLVQTLNTEIHSTFVSAGVAEIDVPIYEPDPTVSTNIHVHISPYTDSVALQIAIDEAIEYFGEVMYHPLPSTPDPMTTTTLRTTTGTSSLALLSPHGPNNTVVIAVSVACVVVVVGLIIGIVVFVMQKRGTLKGMKRVRTFIVDNEDCHGHANHSIVNTFGHIDSHHPKSRAASHNVDAWTSNTDDSVAKQQIEPAKNTKSDDRVYDASMIAKAHRNKNKDSVGTGPVSRIPRPKHQRGSSVSDVHVRTKKDAIIAVAVEEAGDSSSSSDEDAEP